MKAKQLIKLLEEYEDYEVCIPLYIDETMSVAIIDIKWIWDIGVSDKILYLNVE